MSELKLYRLKAKDNLAADDNPWPDVYDKTTELIVAAHSAKEARQLAGDAAMDEGCRAWKKPEYSTCKPFNMPKKAQVILAA